MRTPALNRRRFLGASLVALARAEASSPGRIIDTHIHLYDPNRPQGVPWPPKNDPLLYRRTLPEDFMAATEGLGVTGAVVIESNALLEDNQWVLDLAAGSPLIAAFVGHLDPGNPSFSKHLARFAGNRLFRGVRLTGKAIASGLSQPAFVAGLQQLADRDLQIDAIGDHTMFRDLITVSDRAPRLRIVIDHLPFEFANDATVFRELASRPQIYAKVSGVLRRDGDRTPMELSFYRDSLDRLWENFGRDRLLYGSNWPVSNRFAPYPTVLRIVQEYFTGKGAEASERYFWKNSLAAYKWSQ
jgi:predicted TIM-barrel fold metal-dependent hydrolase